MPTNPDGKGNVVSKKSAQRVARSPHAPRSSSRSPHREQSSPTSPSVLCPSPTQTTNDPGTQQQEGEDGEQFQIDDSAAVTRDELESLLEEFKSSISTQTTAIVSSATSRVESAVKMEVVSLLRGYDAKANTRVSALETRTKAVEATQDQQAKDLAQMHEDIIKLQRQMALAETVIPDKDFLEHGRFDRAPDFSILRVEAAEAIAKDALASAIAPLYARADLDLANAELIGPTLGKRFVLQFHGTSGLAARRARKFNYTMRNKSGEWEKLFAKSPTDGDVRVYINIDKSPRHIKTEIQTKRPEKTIKNLLPSNHIHANRYTKAKEGQIFADWKPLAKLSMSEEAPPTILWNHQVVHDLGFDKQKAVELFSAAATVQPNVQWSL